MDEWERLEDKRIRVDWITGRGLEVRALMEVRERGVASCAKSRQNWRVRTPALFCREIILLGG